MPTGNTTKEKLKLACYWTCSCGGCDVAVLDTNAKILDLADAADIVFWPVAVDGKKADVEAMSDRSIDICLMNGAIRTEENREMALLLRRKSKILVAFGTCAHTGGIHGLINTTDAGTIRETVFIDSPSIDNPEGTIPKTRVVMPAGELGLPDLFDTVCRLEDVVPVDYSVPGCPPAAARVGEIIDAILAGKLPPPGTVLGASEKALCETCPRRPRDGNPADFTRPHLAQTSAETCFLERGIVCLGPVTRGGCGEQCVGGGMPCIGCYGPTPGTLDTGGAMIGVLASLIESRDPAEIERMAGSVRDPLGTFYLFTMARSLLRNVRRT